MRVSQPLILLAGLALAACNSDTTTPEAIGTTAEADVVIVEPKLSSATSSDASVSVIHGINGTDLGLSAALPVDVSVNGDVQLRRAA